MYLVVNLFPRTDPQVRDLTAFCIPIHNERYLHYFNLPRALEAGRETLTG